jgi:CBS domain-containing protein
MPTARADDALERLDDMEISTTTVDVALERMKRARVRRLPIVGLGGTVVGIISIDDIARAAGPRKAIRSDEVVATLQALGAHHQLVAPVAAA